MDYTEAFQNLRTNNKYGRRSPHKAVMMLAVIELFEQNRLTVNEIPYDDTLKEKFLEIWNKVLPQEKKFHPDAYLPYWYLQGDSFWHIVPVWGEEDVLALMRNENIKPSEAKLYKSVRYAELDEDLYFLMTLSSGRSSLKKALLENYFSLTEEQITQMSESKDNIIDSSEEAVKQYEDMLTTHDSSINKTYYENDSSVIKHFQELDEDLQIAFNIVYYSFLKSHRSERNLIKGICPSVYNLYDQIAYHPIKMEDTEPSFVFSYEDLLFDLKISLMSEDDTMELIDKIGEAIEVLHGNYHKEDEKEPSIIEPEDFEEKASILQEEKKQEETKTAVIETVIPEELYSTENRKGKAWTENEEELVTLYFRQGRDVASIAGIMGRTEVSIKMRLAKLGLIDYTYGQDDDSSVSGQVDSSFTSSQEADKEAVNPDDFIIENSFLRCALKNRRGDKVFSADGKLKRIGDKLYRLNLKRECLTIKDMKFEGDVWMRGDKKIVAYPDSALYDILDGNVRYENMIEDIVDGPTFFECRVKVGGKWYDNSGDEIIGGKDLSDITPIKYSFDDTATFVPKGKLRCIGDVAEESYDFLLPMAVVEFMQFTPQPTIITFDRLACMMIAVGWEILGNNEEVREKEYELCECIQFLMDESKEEMSDVLTWSSTKKEVFNAIKDYPMAGVFEDTVDWLTEKSPYHVLKAWLKADEKKDIERESNFPSSTCLYAIHPMTRNPYIEVKQGWMRYLRKEHEALMDYFERLYLDYLDV